MKENIHSTSLHERKNVDVFVQKLETILNYQTNVFFKNVFMVMEVGICYRVTTEPIK